MNRLAFVVTGPTQHDDGRTSMTTTQDNVTGQRQHDNSTEMGRQRRHYDAQDDNDNATTQDKNNAR